MINFNNFLQPLKSQRKIEPANKSGSAQGTRNLAPIKIETANQNNDFENSVE